MSKLPRQIGVAVDLAGCPNRCRHCYLGNVPNGTLPRELLAEAAESFWSWTRPGEATPYFQQVDVLPWYREPDFSDDYRELYDLSAELSRREPRRYELLSIWRLARDPDYAIWAKERGPKICQISFFGMAELTDHFHRRRGAFRDNITATRRLLEVGMIPRWQVFLTGPGMDDLGGIMSLVDELGLYPRVADLGGRFDIFCHPPGPEGESWNIEDIRIEQDDLARVPEALLESSREHFGGKIGWEAESVLIGKIIAGMAAPPYVPAETWFFINSDCDVFSNYGELDGYWRLGNFKTDGVAAMMAKFEADCPAGLQAAFHAPRAELAKRFGRTDSRKLYAPGDLVSRWIHLHVRQQRNSPNPLEEL
ncbi:hypothetical protein LCGC14_1904600 [marine sediment metagenome]|uniref:Radical SAM core domain-containing protein n=1 Tax=marine sediment metagenome TaxID=412755 RepID=A0A0F9I9F4_9ZZZZ